MEIQAYYFFESDCYTAAKLGAIMTIIGRFDTFMVTQESKGVNPFTSFLGRNAV